jgi:hypothetical protein
MEHCITCGMPLEKPEFCGMKTEDGPVCIYCANNGEIRSCEEIFEGGVQFFMQAMKSERGFAEKLVRKNMLGLPFWKGKECKCLEGEVATDEEFAEAAKKL